MNDNPKNNILLSENIRQRRLTTLEYFDAYQQIDNDDKYMHQNIPEFLVLFVWYFPTIRCYFWIIVHILWVRTTSARYVGLFCKSCKKIIKQQKIYNFYIKEWSNLFRIPKNTNIQNILLRYLNFGLTIKAAFSYDHWQQKNRGNQWIAQL